MKAPPRDIDNARVLRYAIIDERCTPTGLCEHRILGAEFPMGPATSLAICRYPKNPGYYLFHCDEIWAVQSDGYHDSLEEAERQAELEYTGVSACWIQAL